MNETIRQHMSARLRPLQVIVGTMTLGATAFLIVASVVGGDAVAPPGGTPAAPILTYLCAGFGAVALIARILIPGVMTTSARANIVKKRTDSGATPAPQASPGEGAVLTDVVQLCNAYASMVIVRAAVVEGAALLAAVAFFVERTPLSAVVAIVLILALVAQIPTHTVMTQWLETESRYLEQTLPPIA